MGRSVGLFRAVGANFRVSAQPRYTPSYTRADGLVIHQRIKIPVGMNGMKNPKTGVASKDFFQLVAWGKLADLCAKVLNKGRAFDAEVIPHAFPSRYFIGNVQLTGPDGKPVMIDRVEFTIVGGTFVIGEEAQELVDEEIRTGRRHVNWDKKNHPDNIGWMQLSAAWNAVPFNPQLPEFGFAKVVMPSTPAPMSLPNQVQEAFTPAPMGAPAPLVNTVRNGGFTQKPANAPATYNAAGQPGHIPF